MLETLYELVLNKNSVHVVAEPFLIGCASGNYVRIYAGMLNVSISTVGVWIDRLSIFLDTIVILL